MSEQTENEPGTGPSAEGAGEGTDFSRPAPDRNTMMIVLAYLPVLCLVPLLAEDSAEQMRQHARQGLVLTVVFLVIMVLRNTPDLLLGILDLAMLGVIILFIAAMVKALQGGIWRIPYIADLAERTGKRRGGESD